MSLIMVEDVMHAQVW